MLNNTNAVMLLNSKALKNQSGFIYPSPAQIVEQLNLPTNNILADIGSQVTTLDNADEYTAFTNYRFESIIRSPEFNGMQFNLIIGFIVNFEKNVFVAYFGEHVSACLNLNVYGAQMLQRYDFSNYTAAAGFFANANSYADESISKIKLLSKPLPNNFDFNNFLGTGINFAAKGEIKTGTSCFVQVAKNACKKDNIYYFAKLATIYDLYNALTFCNHGTDLNVLPQKSSEQYNFIRSYFINQFNEQL